MTTTPLQDGSLPTMRNLNNLLTQRNQQLAAITRTWDALRLTPDLDALLATIAQAAHETLGFGVVVLNGVDQSQDVVAVRAYAGLSPEARTTLDGATYTWNTFVHLLDPRFRRGSCYFIPAGAFDWRQSLGDAVYIPTALASSDTADHWQAEDALFVVVERRDGEVVGIISVDEPRDGQRPTAETLQVLDIFSAQAAIALENAQLYAQVLEAHRAALRQLATPLIPLTDRAVLLPLVGAVDVLRAQQMRDDVLAGLVSRPAATLILDLTGVPTLDGATATELGRTVQAAQLIGAQVLLTGIHPALARALLTVGEPLDNVRMYGTVQQGVAAALSTTAALHTSANPDLLAHRRRTYIP